jgi:hypothetical protein
MATNLATYYIDSAARTPREVQVPLADWDGGMNTGASNAPGVGINTGDYNPKESDWPRPVAAVLEQSQIIGGVQSGLFAIDATFGPTALVAFVQATAAVAPDATIATVSGFPMVNRTGKTVPNGAWVWGVANNP